MSNEQLREALQRIQYKAVSLADAQVIALEALASQTTPPAAPSQEPAVPQGWTDADADAARLNLELECLLLDTENLSVVSKWWASANEALELHRRRLATPAAPSQDPYKDSTPHLSEKEALR